MDSATSNMSDNCQLCQIQGNSDILGDIVTAWDDRVHLNCLRFLSFPLHRDSYLAEKQNLYRNCNHCQVAATLVRCSDYQCNIAYHLRYFVFYLI